MKNLNRREFVNQTAVTAAACVVLGGRQALAANEKIVIGFMGLGGRGTGLLEKYAARKDVEIAWLCDADSRRIARAETVVTKAGRPKPKTSQDFRKLLEDAAVQAVVNATPDHWHAPGTIMACQAGKDVYVEKPLSHNLWEGRKMIEAARKYQRVVQLGTQSRSSLYTKQAFDFVQSGKLGAVHLVRVFNMMHHPAMQKAPDQPPPELDYELWCGPAAKLPYNSAKRWLNFFEYSCGPIPGDAIHQLDLARAILGDPPAPKTVTHTGGIYAHKDGRDTPDTQIATFEYDGFSLVMEASLWTPYIKKTPMEMRDVDKMPNWPFNSTRVEILGTKGIMFFGRHGEGWQVFDEKDAVVAQEFGRQGDNEHIGNFLECIRTRQPATSDVEKGHQSTLLCHLANISWRVGNRKLTFDAATETFPEVPEANKFLRREAYRAPFAITDKV